MATNNYLKAVFRHSSRERELVFIDDTDERHIANAIAGLRVRAGNDRVRIIAYRTAPLLVGRVDGLVGINDPIGREALAEALAPKEHVPFPSETDAAITDSRLASN
jgi:hypothetical protein